MEKHKRYFEGCIIPGKADKRSDTLFGDSVFRLENSFGVKEWPNFELRQNTLGVYEKQNVNTL